MASQSETYNNEYLDLSKAEFRLLCFLAYYGELKPQDTVAKAYRRSFRISSQSYNKDSWKLVEKGYLQTKTFVKPERRLNVLMCLYKSYPSWVESFKHIEGNARSNSAEYLCKIVQLLIKDDFVSASKIMRPFEGLGYKQFNLFKYIQEQIIGDARYIKLLNETEIVEMVDDFLREKFEKDELDEETLKLLSDAIPPNHRYHDELIDEMSAYRFFQTGQAQASSGKSTMWSMAVEGITLAYNGDLEEALKSFKAALRLSSGAKNAFPSDIFNYIYGIVICKLIRKYPEDDYYKQCLEVFRQSKAIRLSDENTAIRILIDNMDKDVIYAQDDAKKRMGFILNRHQEVLYQTWALLLYHFFDIKDYSSLALHSSAFFHHELSQYMPIGPEARRQMQDFFGGKPLIGTFRKKQAWEILLTDISDQVSKVHDTIERRIAYYMDGKKLHAIVEQTRKEDGKWHDGKLLSRSQMAETGYEAMDSIDMAIASKLPSASTDSDASILVPLLADTDRLLYGNSYDGRYVPIEVTKEKPYLEFKGKGAQIEISSNVTLDTSGQLHHHIVQMDSNTHFTLITVNALQRDVIKRFLQIKAFPTSALISLRNTIDSLKGIIEVREQLPNPSYETAILSKGILAVRVSPDKNEYLFKISATGLEEGTSRFVPAEGDNIVYDEVDGLTHCVNRDLAKEYENYCQLNTFLKEFSKAEMTGYSEGKIWTLEGLLLLLAFVYDHQDQYFMEWPEGVSLKFKGDIKGSDIDIVVQSDMEWFTLEGDVKIAGKRYSLEELVRICCTSTIEGFVKLNDEEYIRMSEKLKRHIAMMDAFPGQGGKNKKRVSKYNVGALANMIEDLKMRTDGGYTKFMEKTKAAYAIDPEIPSSITAKLRDYQKDGFRWMCRLDAWGAGSCLADDMGLGKTLQALTFLSYKAKEGASIVVAPKSVVLNWASEAARFAPELNVVVLNNVANRDAVIENADANDVILCTYGLLVTESVALTKKYWNVICLDEAHQIKNRQTMASQTAMDMRSKSRIIMTGTPLQNNLSELWNLFQFINPGLLGPWARFRDSFMIPALDNEHKILLKEITQPFILRRTKQEVLSELPEKLLHTHYVEMTDNEAKVYEEMRRQTEVKFKRHKTPEERKEAESLDLNFFTELMKLRQASCSMRLIYDRWAEQSSKIEALMEIIDNISREPENNILVFSQFTSFLEMIKPELKKREMDFLYLDGQTPLEKRQEIVGKFQNGQCRLFLSSLKAGGLGLNLTAANYVILLDPWWNPAIENQAMDRAHRLGQKRVVSVIRLISSNTIEEKILRLHETKQNLSDDILEGTADSYKLTYEDVMDMVSPFY